MFWFRYIGGHAANPIRHSGRRMGKSAKRCAHHLWPTRIGCNQTGRQLYVRLLQQPHPDNLTQFNSANNRSSRAARHERVEGCSGFVTSVGTLRFAHPTKSTPPTPFVTQNHWLPPLTRLIVSCPGLFPALSLRLQRFTARFCLIIRRYAFNRRADKAFDLHFNTALYRLQPQER